MSDDLIKFSMEPRTLEEAIKYADIISKSGLVPKDYQGKPQDILVAIQWGQEVGLKPLQALQNIAVINGRPSLWGDATLSLVRASGLLEDFREDFDERAFTSTCTAKRKGQATEIVRTFSRSDAEKAGLWDRNTWKSYPKRMCQMRARAFCLRDGFADVLKGVGVVEEEEDKQLVDAEYKITEPPAGPKRLSEQGAKPGTTTAQPEAAVPVGITPEMFKEWETVILNSPSIPRLQEDWTRLTQKPAGLYHRMNHEQQTLITNAKDIRKSQLDPGSDIPFE